MLGEEGAVYGAAAEERDGSDFYGWDRCLRLWEFPQVGRCGSAVYCVSSGLSLGQDLEASKGEMRRRLCSTRIGRWWMEECLRFTICS